MMMGHHDKSGGAVAGTAKKVLKCLPATKLGDYNNIIATDARRPVQNSIFIYKKDSSRALSISSKMGLSASISTSFWSL